MIIDIPCVCGRHDGDVVTLRDTLDFRAAVTIRNAALLAKSEDPDLGTADILAILSERYLLAGIEDWTLADDRGRPVPVTPSTIRERILSRPDVAVVLADAADELYGEKVVLPLLVRAATSSQPGPTSASTSATTDGSSESPTPSSPSSTTNIPTDATETTSPSLVGASSS